MLLPTNYEETIFNDIEDLEEQLNNAIEEKIIVDVSALVNLFTKSRQDQCFKKIKCDKPKFVGSCASIHWECEDSHKGVWYSSKKTRNMYTNNLIVASAIYLSGKNVGKIPDLFNILNVHMQSQRTMELYQCKYIYPVVKDFLRGLRRLCSGNFHNICSCINNFWLLINFNLVCEDNFQK